MAVGPVQSLSIYNTKLFNLDIRNEFFYSESNHSWQQPPQDRQNSCHWRILRHDWTGWQKILFSFPLPQKVGADDLSRSPAMWAALWLSVIMIMFCRYPQRLLSQSSVPTPACFPHHPSEPLCYHNNAHYPLTHTDKFSVSKISFYIVKAEGLELQKKT